MKSELKAFFHKATNTITYVVFDPVHKKSVIIDSVLDYDPSSGTTSTFAADEVISFIQEQNLENLWILETHVHADHLSAAPYLKSQLGGEICIGKNVSLVQNAFNGLFNLQGTVEAFDKLLDDGELLSFGELAIEVFSTPGHTPACVSYKVEDMVFVGDTLFMPDFGTARCDFPGGDASQLYVSIKRILSLPEDTRLFMCHDYGHEGRGFEWETTVSKQRKSNVHIRDDISEEAFVTMRSARDKELNMPALILPSVQVNMCGGKIPEPEDNGIAYLKIPLNQF
ncbi:MAG: MBL fold metallo-hydrolase [SAR86 cluster bacterium]|uniref:MBL fold metallo-hydrolase n=1 Tax=SAR86 cluster bacterium TaxID=2030880 RepID=A0A2A4X917_9GAMM|nr:MBL fold metallo-hydrolase [Sneathiella sp.]PCI78801.1 MAG: MBL fold metallo-hydrolase [SAR86 cluster bacterium]